MKKKQPPSKKSQRRGVSKKPAFLKAFRLTASITEAAKAVSIDRSVHYDWMRLDAKYPAQFEAAKVEAAESLEDEAVRRAKEGVLKPVFYQGRPCGAERVYSDGLMQFLLRGFMPQKYRQVTEISGPGGGPIENTLTVEFVKPKAA